MTIERFAGDHRWLSNFHLCMIPGDDGYSYPSVEHGYQAMKTLDLVYRQKIRLAEMASIAKKLGKVVPQRDPLWDDHKLGVMERLVRAKFTLHPWLKQKLEETGTEDIIEGNTWGDTFWGCTKSPSGHWMGQNHLGRLLVQIRSENKLTRILDGR